MPRLTRAERQARTREELLAAAARVVARRGYDAASVAEIADEAGYSHGAVYSNFVDKEDLFLALYETWVAERVSEIEESHDVRAAADEWMQRVAKDPAAFLLRLEFTARAARDPKLRRKLGARVGAVPLAIGRSVEVDEELALGLQALSLGLALEALANPDAVRPGLAGELAERLVR
jgi:AcrR family transcriptional regulator